VAVGIDPSWTGTAVVCVDLETLAEKHWLLKTAPKHGSIHSYRRHMVMFKQLTEVLSEIERTYTVVHVCVEDFARNAKNGREESGSIRSLILLTLGWVFGDTREASPTLVATTQLKKFATGNGGAGMQKSQVIKYVDKKWGFDTANDNLADAYVLARVGVALECPTSVSLQYERDVLANLGRHSLWEPLAQPQ
jgi:Holliday junction resolvasome RuvABC endonuclease subunit